MRIRNVSTRLRQRNGINATITRGGQSCVLDHDSDPNTGIVLARNTNGNIEQHDYSVEADAQDVLVSATDYAPTGTPSRPALDDRIAVAIGGANCVLRVIVPDGSSQCYRSCDPEGTELRVHTKRF